MIYFNSQRKPISTVQIIMGLLFVFSLLYIGFYITKWVLIGLSFLAPILLISAMFIHFATVKNFAIYLWQSIVKNPLYGIALTLLSIVGFPITCLILFFRARSRARLEKMNYEAEGFSDSEYIDYIELPEEDIDNVDSMKNYR
ncbi:hypothetical protein [Membranihabitans marinus]|uniref:hypothetical protein n=1 Tax=Membranihabitans marinus TaxID=1227546 RepID=UPI001F19D504|nr:hypothetical protein [Membranihabitans marinus]